MNIAQDVKAWLKAYGEQVRYIDYLIERADLLEAQAQSPRTARIDGMPHNRTRDTDQTGAALAKLDSLREQLAEATDTERQLYTERSKAISQITGKRWPEWRAVLHLRYLDCLPWNDVSFSLFGSKEDYSEREESYLRRTHNLNKEALKALEKIIPLQSGGNEVTQ